MTTEARRAAQARYEKTEKCRIMRARYNHSQKNRVVQARWKGTLLGVLAATRDNAKRRGTR